MNGWCRTVVALAAIASVASGQPMPDPTSQGEPRGTAGDTRIPVTMPGSTEVLGAENAAATSSPAPISIEQPIDADAYICGPGDVFELNFWGPQNFRLKIAVDLEGRTFISKVGFVPVAGKSLSAVRTAIKSKVRGTYPGLQFDLTLVTPRTFLVHVVDMVKQPGTYPTHALERVSSVVARAGAVQNGSRRRIAVKHRNGSTITADLVLYELTGDTSYNPYLLDGDVVTVPFADPVVGISGAVRRPGSYELVETKDLTEALRLANGFTPQLTRSLPIRVVHYDEQQHEHLTTLPFANISETPNVALHDHDAVQVPAIDELQRSVMLIGAVSGADQIDPATTSKRVPFVEGDTVLSLLDRAGGIKTAGDLQHSYISHPRANQAPEVIPIDLDALLIRRDFHADKPIQMGDALVVPAMQYSVLVEGAVARAGLYPYNPLFSIPEYIGRAGGRTRTARDLDDVQLIDINGKTRSFRTGMKPNPGDSIVVPERNFTRPEIVQLVLAGAGLVLSGVAITIAATR